MHRTLIILTLNEIQGSRELYMQIPHDEIDEVFVIDGGSTDGTREFYEKHGIRVYGQVLAGRGYAMRHGIEIACGENIVFFSPDGNENPKDIVKLFECLEHGYDMVIASRFLPGSRNEESGKAFPLRLWTNRMFTLIANLIWNRKAYITDTINGFRGVNKSSFERMGITENGFTIEYQMSIKAMKHKMKVLEVPTLEGQRISGKSKAPSLITGIRFLRYIFRELFGTESLDIKSIILYFILFVLAFLGLMVLVIVKGQ